MKIDERLGSGSAITEKILSDTAAQCREELPAAKLKLEQKSR